MTFKSVKNKHMKRSLIIYFVAMLLFMFLYTKANSRNVTAVNNPIHSMSMDDEVNGDVFRAEFSEVREEARKSGKHYVTYFYASWCKPCQWMDANVFNDQEVISYLSNNLLSAKVDIDGFEGHGLKNLFNVDVMPTFLVFNSEGRIVKRVETTLDKHEFLSMLKSVLEPKRVIVQQPASPVVSSRPTHYEKTVVTENSVEKYRLQAGIFKQKENMTNYAGKLSRMTSDMVDVREIERNGEQMYRIVIGGYSTLEDALAAQKHFKSKKIDTILFKD